MNVDDKLYSIKMHASKKEDKDVHISGAEKIVEEADEIIGDYKRTNKGKRI